MRMHYAGICGTDVHLLSTDSISGFVRSSAPVFIPEAGRMIGHEGIGQVVEIGADVAGIVVGDWVVPASIIDCGTCLPCRSGSPNQCLSATLVGLQEDGLFGTYADLPAQLSVVVTPHAVEDADRQALACLEPAGTALQACELAGIRPNDEVVVFGGGPIGLFSAIIAKAIMGCAKVTLVEPEKFRRDHAARWCDMVCAPDAFEAATDKADILIEASGVLANVTRAIPRLRARGRVVLLARSGEPLVIDHVDHMISELITIMGCRGHLGGYLDQILSFYAAGRFPLSAVITSVHSGIDKLKALLSEPEQISRRDCKILVRL